MKITPIVIGGLDVNCYLIIDEATNTAAVIDPGDESDKIAAVIREAGVSVSHILLTHGHFDHSWAVGQLQQEFDVELRMHEKDVNQLDGPSDLVQMFYDPSKYIAPKLGPFISHGDVLELGETRIKVVHTPGHTQGGVSFLIDGVAITGDTLFAGGVGRWDFPGGDHDQLIESIRDNLLTLPDDTVVYPGHGPSSTIGEERVGNPWLR